MRWLAWLDVGSAGVGLLLVLTGDISPWWWGVGWSVGAVASAAGLYVSATVVDCAIFAARGARSLQKQIENLKREQTAQQRVMDQVTKQVDQVVRQVDDVRTILVD